jgi:hypothetical protein
VAVKSDVKTGHDIAYVTRGHASGCTGAMAYYTHAGDPPGTWEGRGTAALGVSGTVEAEVAERLYQEGVGLHGERIIKHAAPQSDEDQAAAEAAAVARYQGRASVRVRQRDQRRTDPDPSQEPGNLPPLLRRDQQRLQVDSKASGSLAWTDPAPGPAVTWGSARGRRGAGTVEPWRRVAGRDQA